MSQPQPVTNGIQTAASSRLDVEITTLSALLSRGQDGAELSEQELVALLRQLEQANGVAQGVEDRLDNMLRGLDDMLAGMESGRASESRSKNAAATHTGTEAK
ncbi:hypothetical protein PUNSTDRAFT_129862 [Punctularia strigosozonata HHB-11173 SS5]|uniref:uncharacterized protein n=1 Tax=Punctularia strigosozonata (strain HHB-11173) TaxID=741275 RepID=UPI0004417A82|nr:uncharacterized protein PUNSTDRAFT_129862 [Punctularia strigosozonata HHB-11173 SS5]EIN14233.1 hypothetical protein PUNSTDRAFT_129862 [Punctularia strigosozonata HHB-11173 SS5]